VGYYGPVCLDGLLWRDRGTTRIRPLVDLNARLHASLAALRVWRGWGEDRVVFWRLFSRRKLLLPETHRGLERALGEDAFDPATRTGIVVTSPLWIDKGDGRRPPQRLGVLCAGTSRDETICLEKRFREIFE